MTSIGETITISDINFKRVANDTNGNPRYVCHYTNLLSADYSTLPYTHKYAHAVQKAKTIGGKKYNNKQYGGGVIFQSYNINETAQDILELRNS